MPLPQLQPEDFVESSLLAGTERATCISVSHRNKVSLNPEMPMEQDAQGAGQGGEHRQADQEQQEVAC